MQKKRFITTALLALALLLTGCSGQSAQQAAAPDLGVYASYINTDLLSDEQQAALQEACWRRVDQSVTNGGYSLTIRSLLTDGVGLVADCVLASESGTWDEAVLETLLDGEVKHISTGGYELMDADHFVQNEEGALEFQFQMWTDRDLSDTEDLTLPLRLYGMYDLWDQPVLEGEWSFSLPLGTPLAYRYEGSYTAEMENGAELTVTEVVLTPFCVEADYAVNGVPADRFDFTTVALNALTLADGTTRPASRQGGDWSGETEITGVTNGRQTRLLDPADVTAVLLGSTEVPLDSLTAGGD